MLEPTGERIQKPELCSHFYFIIYLFTYLFRGLGGAEEERERVSEAGMPSMEPNTGLNIPTLRS